MAAAARRFLPLIPARPAAAWSVVTDGTARGGDTLLALEPVNDEAGQPGACVRACVRAAFSAPYAPATQAKQAL